MDIITFAMYQIVEELMIPYEMLICLQINQRELAEMVREYLCNFYIPTENPPAIILSHREAIFPFTLKPR